MKTRTVAAAVLVSLTATLAGCGGSDPAGAKVEEFFALMGKGSISRAIPECGSASEPKDPFALKSWGDKFRGMVGGKVRKTVYTDDAGTEVAASKATKATVYYKCFEGIARRSNRQIWMIKMVKEKDKSGNDKWCILYGPSETMRRGEIDKWLEEN